MVEIYQDKIISLNVNCEQLKNELRSILDIVELLKVGNHYGDRDILALLILYPKISSFSGKPGIIDQTRGKNVGNIPCDDGNLGIAKSNAIT